MWWKNRDMREPLLVDAFNDRPDLGLAVFVLKSNTLTERMAAGKVESADLVQLSDAIDERAGDAAFSFLYKIAVVHHHPAPIANAPSDALARIADSFMIFYNAGLFLRELSRRGFNLVLHGHRHVAGYLRIACEFPREGRTELPVAAAGSASHPHPDDTRGNHLHLVELYDDDTAKLTSRFFSADVEEQDGSCEYRLETLADVRRRRYSVFRQQRKYSCLEHAKTIAITLDGYTSVQMDFRGCRAAPGKELEMLPLSLTTVRPGYIRGVQMGDGASQFQEMRPLDANLYAYKAEIHLAQKYNAESGRFAYGYRYRLMNGHTLTAEEFARHYSGTNVSSEYASITCDGAYDQLSLTIGFPHSYDLGRLEFQAIAEYVPAPLRGVDDPRLDRGESVTHDEETERIRGYLNAAGNPIEFTCPDPVPGMIYKVCWRFRQAPQPAASELALAAQIETAKQKLLDVATAAKQGVRKEWNRARVLLDRLVSDVNQILNRALAVSGKEDLRMNVMIFDDASQRLKFVCVNADPSELPEYDFISGEGCAGFAFEKVRYLLYHPARDPLGYFIHKNEGHIPANAGEPVAMASFPWIYKRLAVGVVNLSSSARTTKLLKVFDMQTDQQQTVMAELQDLVNLGVGELLTI
jgi:hypothetical protein